MTGKALLAWSHSAVELFRQCPHRYYQTRITKQFKDEFKGPAADWGLAVHKAMERRVRLGVELPANMSQYEPVAKLLEAMPGQKFTELQLALNIQRKQVDWFASDVWCRIVLDLLVLHPSQRMAFVLDYKTGKRKEDDSQLALCAAGVFALYPSVEKVISGYYWLGEQKFDRATFVRKFEDRLWGLYLPHVERMEEAARLGEWPKKPSGLCRGWCPVSNCQFWEAKKEK